MIGSHVSHLVRVRAAQVACAVGVVAVAASIGWWLSSTTWTTLNGARVSCGLNAYHLAPADPGPPPHPLWDACEHSHQPNGAPMATLAVVGFVIALLAAVAMARLPLKVWCAPPGWPPAPPRWQPPIGWVPPAEWPPAPAQWKWWQ